MRKIDIDALESPFDRTPSDQRVTDRDADITQHRGIGEIALPSRYGQLVCKETQQCVRNAQIALAILEVDRVDLVRHGGGADLSRKHALPEIAERDVTPHVAAQIDQHRVDARERIEILRHPVVRFDLCGVWIPGEPERLDKAAREARPIDVRVSDAMRIEVADCTVDFAGDRYGRETHALFARAIDEVRDFLAERRRRRGLTMRARHHRRRGMFVCERAQPS